MKSTTLIQIVRHFHRWSGIALILLVGAKILTGFNAAGNIQILPISRAYQFHLSIFIDILLLFLFIGHALYGLFKMVQGKVKNKVMVFLWMNVIGLLIFSLSIVFVYFI